MQAVRTQFTMESARGGFSFIPGVLSALSGFAMFGKSPITGLP
jgi:hypothetical protein